MNTCGRVAVEGHVSAGCDVGVGAGERGGVGRGAGIWDGAGVRAVEVGVWDGGVNKNAPKKHGAILFFHLLKEGRNGSRAMCHGGDERLFPDGTR